MKLRRRRGEKIIVTRLNKKSISRWAAFGALFVVSGVGLLPLLPGCGGGKPTVVLYTDQDKSVVEPLAKQFTEDKKIDVEIVYADPAKVQEGKGLSERIAEESGSPKADLYWACGPQAVEKLNADGQLDGAGGSNVLQLAKAFSEANYHWTGFGARVRVLLYNRQAFANKKPPLSLAALGRPEWKGRVAYADPRKNGNAAYHLLTYFAAYGTEDGTRLLEKIKENGVLLLPDENAVVEAVASGKADWGITDSDLATAAVVAKKPVDYLVSDQEDFATSDALGQVRGAGFPTLGTPALPLPLAVIHNRPHTDDAKKMNDFLLSPQSTLRLLQLMPNMVMTRISQENAKAGREEGHIVNADRLRFATLGMDKIGAVRPQFTLALVHILNDTP